MKKGRFSEEKMVAILQEAERSTVAKVAKRYGVSEVTIYNWRKHFTGMQPTDVRRLKALDQENARLKKILAERDIEIEVMKEINVKSGERARSPPAGRLRYITRPVGEESLHATSGCPFGAALSVEDDSQGCGGRGCHELSVRVVSTLWLPPYSSVPW
jgi:putative transposase